MKKTMFILLAAVAVTSFSLLSTGANRADAVPAEGSVKLIVAQFTDLTVAPLDQTREISDTAQLLVTLTGTGCVLQLFFPASAAPQSFASLCSELNGQLVSSPPISPSLPPAVLNPITFAGSFDVVGGIHQGSVHVPLGFTVNPAAFVNMPLGQAFTFQVQALASYVDFDHRVGSDTGQATAFVLPNDIEDGCLLGYFDLTGVSGGLAVPIGCVGNNPLVSNQANVRWIKTGAIDTGIFVRRTPVVEQAAAPPVQAPATGTGRITAPNTGDGGLQASGGSRSDLALPLAIALGLAGACGAFVLHRRRRAT